MPPRSVLQGDLGLLSLFDLGQLLMLNRATGELTVNDEGRRGALFFEQGFIVNAVDDEFREGEGAAYRLFTWKSGHFEFLPGSATGTHAITENSEGLMMEAARRMDEAGIGRDGGEVDKLAQRASSLEALREAFQSVASETAERPEIGPESDGSAFELLREPGDALLFRPGRVPRARASGRWRNVGKGPLDVAGYDTLRGRLLDATPSGAVAAGPRIRQVMLENGRRYTVTHLSGDRESLWVRPSALAPPGAARLDGDLAAMDAALSASTGLLLASGPDATTADQMFHACVSRLVEVRGCTVMLVADHDRWIHADRAGAVLLAVDADAQALAQSSAPDIAAFDLAHARTALATLGLTSRTIAAVVAPDAESAPARWAASLARRWGDGFEAAFAGGRVDVVHATGGAGVDARLPFVTARPLGVSTEPDAAPLPEPGESSAETTGRAASPATAAPAPEPAPEPAPGPPASKRAGASRPKDAMAALAAELSRSLRKAA